MLYILNTLLNAPRLDSSPPTSLSDLLSTAAKVIRRRSLVFLISDFYSEPGWERHLGNLAQRHEILAVRVFDPLEMELPDLGMLLMSDRESGEQILVDTHNRGFRRRFAEAAEAHEAALRRGLAKAGVDGLEISTRDDLLESIVKYAALRKQMAGRR